MPKPSLKHNQIGATHEMMIDVDAVPQSTLRVQIVGLTPLLVSAMPTKVKQIIAENNEKKKSSRAKSVDDRGPVEKYLDAFYIREDGSYGIRCDGMRKSMISAAGNLGMTMTVVSRMGFFIKGKDSVRPGDGQLVRILGEPEFEERAIKTKGKKDAQLSYVARFPKWGAVVDIEYNSDSINEDSIVNLLEHAGFNIGIGNYRPEGANGGDNGRFCVVRTPEHKALMDELIENAEDYVFDAARERKKAERAMAQIDAGYLDIDFSERERTLV